jgi:Protein of unknown function (DUF3606)
MLAHARGLVETVKLRRTSMPDDKTKVGEPDRSRVSADQDYEVRQLAEKHGLSPIQIRELIARVGNDREQLEKAAKELRGQRT